MNTNTGYIPTLEAHREKVTMSLRPDRVRYADRKADERGVSRSEIIDSLIAEAEAREIETLMIAGYRAMAQENHELAEEGMGSFRDLIKEDPDWSDERLISSAPSSDRLERHAPSESRLAQSLGKTQPLLERLVEGASARRAGSPP